MLWLSTKFFPKDPFDDTKPIPAKKNVSIRLRNGKIRPIDIVFGMCIPVLKMCTQVLKMFIGTFGPYKFGFSCSLVMSCRIIYNFFINQRLTQPTKYCTREIMPILDYNPSVTEMFQKLAMWLNTFYSTFFIRLTFDFTI